MSDATGSSVDFTAIPASSVTVDQGRTWHTYDPVRIAAAHLLDVLASQASDEVTAAARSLAKALNPNTPALWGGDAA